MTLTGCLAHSRGSQCSPKAAAGQIGIVLFPLRCPNWGGEVRIIAFLTDAPTVRANLAHLGEPTTPPRSAPARGPPLWAAAGAEHDPILDPPLPPAPAYEFDQRLTW